MPLHRLSDVCKIFMRESQVSFRPDCGYVHQNFFCYRPWKVDALRKLVISAIDYPKAAFNAVDRADH